MSEVVYADGRQFFDGDDSLVVQPDARYLDAAARHIDVKLAPNEKREARSLLRRFLKACELNNADIDYSQARPFRVIVTPDGFEGDCSSYPTQGFAWVNRELKRKHGPNAFQLHDPNGYREYDGIGNTSTLLATNHTHHVPLERKFFVGDIAIYGSFHRTRHCTICSKNGTASIAEWSSHGSSRGPRQESLFYRSDLLGVYRPVSLL